MIYGRDGHRHFVLQADADGDERHPDYPLGMLDWFSVRNRLNEKPPARLCERCVYMPPSRYACIGARLVRSWP